MRHVLVVTSPEPGRKEFEVVHPDGCPRHYMPLYSAASNFLVYECDVGQMIQHVGLPDAIDGDAESLPVGAYLVYVEHYRDHYGDYDSWLEVRDMPTRRVIVSV